MGSIAEECVQRCKHPVLLVKKGDKNLELAPRELVQLRRGGKIETKHR